MKAHISYLKYLLRHKYYVYIACGWCGVGRWQALIHDWHKFLPSEWSPYVETFYNPDGSKRYVESEAFNVAWNLHQKRGKHHWQHWLLTFDRGNTVALEMPNRYAREMVADWYGAGRAITGEWSAHHWYEKNKANMQLHTETRTCVESHLKFISAQLELRSRLGIPA